MKVVWIFESLIIKKYASLKRMPYYEKKLIRNNVCVLITISIVQSHLNLT